MNAPRDFLFISVLLTPNLSFTSFICLYFKFIVSQLLLIFILLSIYFLNRIVHSFVISLFIFFFFFFFFLFFIFFFFFSIFNTSNIILLFIYFIYIFLFLVYCITISIYFYIYH